MTRQEAIEWFKLMKEKFENTKYADALNMAIETLQHEQERREDIYECSNCLGEVHINYIYCPFCGIKVGEQNNESLLDKR